MRKLIQACAVMLLVASCASNATPPRNATNACAILAERPDFARAMRASERKWGVPVHVQMATIYQESSFRGDARPPRRWLLGFIPRGRASSSYGYAQALDSTWREYQEKEGGRWARRDRIHDAADFIGWTMSQTERSMGISRHDAANQYLVFHEGRTGYRRGTYRNKPWLMNVARRVETRAANYKRQLASCR
ncbi:lytic transglycosylase [Falsirhodobacter deserti]|uniref:transglycosylase SLT domain-containing protein n=1 Tax=Falsirhodobacter deserti TaxID=1365611 RepID=UPI000FE2CD85|nr:lytic transglycosylase [Falsirhodobacter deserti]